MGRICVLCLLRGHLRDSERPLQKPVGAERAAKTKNHRNQAKLAECRGYLADIDQYLTSLTANSRGHLADIGGIHKNNSSLTSQYQETCRTRLGDAPVGRA